MLTLEQQEIQMKEDVVKRPLALCDRLMKWYPMLEVEHARKLLAEFNMPEAACKLDALLETATAKDSTFISFLDQLLSISAEGTN